MYKLTLSDINTQIEIFQKALSEVKAGDNWKDQLERRILRDMVEHLLALKEKLFNNKEVSL